MRKFLLLLILAFITCDLQRDLPTPATPDTLWKIEKARFPEVLNPDRRYIISVSLVGGNENVRIDSVKMSIYKQGENTPQQIFYLYDDGGAIHPEDEDVVAHDGYFTQQIIWQPSTRTKENYTFEFVVPDQGSADVEPLNISVQSMDNKPPAIVNVSLPERLPSGFTDPILIEVTVIDSTGIDDIARVTLTGTRGDTTFTAELYDDGTHGDRTIGDGIFTLAIDRTFAAGKNGNYKVEFIAADKSEMPSDIVVKDLFIENGPPQIKNLDALEQIDIPSFDNTVDFLITLDVDDPQGLEDVMFVGFMSLKPDSTYANQGAPVPLVDNGLEYDRDRWSQYYFGDLIAGDGTYSMTAFVKSTDMPGRYTWTFYATDHTGNKSNEIKHIIILEQ